MTTTKPVPQQHSSNGRSGDRPWSYSQLSAYEMCPRKWAAETLHKSVKRVEGDQQNYGKDVHAALEKRAKTRTPLPLDLKHHEPNVAGLLNMIPGGQVLAEVKIGINREYKPCGFFDDDVWCRGVIDLICHDDQKALIVDWKTGKIRPDYDQLDLMAALTVCLVPTIEKVVGAFYWLKGRKTSHKIYTPDDTDCIWEGFERRVETFQEAIREQDFPPRQNFLCRKWCPVTGCEHHGIG